MVHLPRQKLYVIDKPDLIRAAQKQHRILSFPPIVAGLRQRSAATVRARKGVLDANGYSDKGGLSVTVDIHDAMDGAPRPGVPLDDMNRDMLKRITETLDGLEDTSITTCQRLHLYAWLRDAITRATTRSVYGPQSPLEDRAVTDAIWEFEKGIMSILIGFLPSITARKSIAARDKFAMAFFAVRPVDALKMASAYAKAGTMPRSRTRSPWKTLVGSRCEGSSLCW